MRRKLILNETIKRMSQEQAEEIAYRWHYREKSDYAIYNISSNEAELKEILDPKCRETLYFTVGDEEWLFGYFRFELTDPSILNMRLGMTPQLTGIGNGHDFILSGMDFAIEYYRPATIQISIESFNRAINLFKYIGFHEVGRTTREFNGKSIECIVMNYDVH